VTGLDLAEGAGGVGERKGGGDDRAEGAMLLRLIKPLVLDLFTMAEAEALQASRCAAPQR